MKHFQRLILSLALTWVLVQLFRVQGALAADPTPTSPPPPIKVTEKPPEKAKPKKTATPTPRPPSGSYLTATPTITETSVHTTTATLTPTATPVPGELQITVYMDENRNNLMDDGEGVENLRLTASAGTWRAEAWTEQGVAVFLVPPEFYSTQLLVQCAYLHWGETFQAPEAEATTAVGVLRLGQPDYPVFLP